MGWDDFYDDYEHAENGLGHGLGHFPIFFPIPVFFFAEQEVSFFEANRFLVTYLSKYSIRNFMLMYMYARIMYHVACIC